MMILINVYQLIKLLKFLYFSNKEITLSLKNRNQNKMNLVDNVFVNKVIKIMKENEFKR